MRSPSEERRVERQISHVLGYGVLLAAAVVFAGGLVYLARHGGEPAAYAVFHGEPSEMRSVGGILRGAAALSGRSLIQLGLLLLIATPLARVVCALLAFARAHDRLYTGVSLIVLAILVVSLSGY